MPAAARAQVQWRPGSGSSPPHPVAEGAWAAASPGPQARHGQASPAAGASPADAAPRPHAAGPGSPRPCRRRCPPEAPASRTPGPSRGRQDGSARAQSVNQQVRPCQGFGTAQGALDRPSPSARVGRNDPITGTLLRVVVRIVIRGWAMLEPLMFRLIVAASPRPWGRGWLPAR